MKSKKNTSKFLSLENLGMLLVVFAIIGLICLLGGDLFFGQLGVNIRKSLLGVFGVTSYVYFFLVSVFGFLIVAGLKIKIKLSFKKSLFLFLAFYSLFSIIHLASAPFNGGYSAYLSKCYSMGYSKPSFGGAFLALSVGLFASILTSVGAYVLFSLIFLSLTVWFISKIIKVKENKVYRNENSSTKNGDVSLPFMKGEYDYRQDRGEQRYDLPVGFKQVNQDGIASQQGQADREDKKDAFDEIYERLKNPPKRKTSSDVISQDASEYSEKNYYGDVTYEKSSVSDAIPRSEDLSMDYKEQVDDSKPNPMMYTPKVVYDKKESREEDYYGNGTESNDNPYSVSDFNEQKEKRAEAKSFDFEKELKKYSRQGEKGGFPAYDDKSRISETSSFEKVVSEEKKDFYTSTELTSTTKDYFEGSSVAKEEEEAVSLEQYDYSDFVFNPFPTGLLKVYNVNENKEKLQEFFDFCSQTILTVIETMRKRQMEISEIHHGPTLTRFDLTVPIGVAIKDITSLQEDMGVQLNSAGLLRIAPIPKTNRVGVEVPNDNRVTVSVRELIESREFQDAKAENIPFVVGKDAIGKVLIMELAKMTHILIAGCSGSGKSVFVRSLLVSMMYKCSPRDMRLIICDPKGVDFVAFKGVPHMLIDEIIVERQKIVKILDWTVGEMGRRYSKLQETGSANIAEYNRIMKGRDEMPRLVLFIDEFADLVSADKINILPKVQILAQKARAAGIHVILAMQRPSVEIISGDIKVNFSTRISLKMQSAIDSRTILNEVGAENLLNHGDMLYSTPDDGHLIRAQGPNIDGEEIQSVVSYLKCNNKCVFDGKIKSMLDKGASSFNLNGESGDDDRDSELKKQALRYVIESNVTSASAIQREFRVGWNTAARIYDWMTKKGYIGNSLEGNKREVKVTMEDYIKLYGNDD